LRSAFDLHGVFADNRAPSMENSQALPASQTLLETAHLRDAFIDALAGVLIPARFGKKAFEMNSELFEDHALPRKDPL
jgi:hypothetical protein